LCIYLFKISMLLVLNYYLYSVALIQLLVVSLGWDSSNSTFFSVDIHKICIFRRESKIVFVYNILGINSFSSFSGIHLIVSIRDHIHGLSYIYISGETVQDCAYLSMRKTITHVGSLTRIWAIALHSLS
jgi:predicted transglutaminase-like protease